MLTHIELLDVRNHLNKMRVHFLIIGNICFRDWNSFFFLIIFLYCFNILILKINYNEKYLIVISSSGGWKSI